MNKQIKSAIIYNGSSLLDGKPIVVIATYSNRNKKTGSVVQTYIMRADMNPLEASKTGQDFSICGNCIMRGETTTDPKRKIAKNRRCYVNLGQGVLIVWKAYKRGVYNPGSAEEVGRHRFVRIGTYGDPAAVPSIVWDQLTENCSSWTAYSHQKGWNPTIAMQSVDNKKQAIEQWDLGNRTFRVIKDLKELDKKKETLCPASKEAGRRVQCTACKLCKGFTKAKSIAIVEH
tara:strand:+ start:226 stop:918 length:693 start_codon:yes stop_codon:yes gene_type:complete